MAAEGDIPEEGIPEEGIRLVDHNLEELYTMKANKIIHYYCTRRGMNES